jgi:hypothetical protein
MITLFGSYLYAVLRGLACSQGAGMFLSNKVLRSDFTHRVCCGMCCRGCVSAVEPEWLAQLGPMSFSKGGAFNCTAQVICGFRRMFVLCLPAKIGARLQVSERT